MRELAGIVATVVLGGLIGVFGSAARAQIENVDPVEPRLERSLAFWQARIDRNPRAYLERTLLGEALIEKASRQRSDEMYAAAEESLRAALEINPRYARAQIALAFG